MRNETTTEERTMSSKWNRVYRKAHSAATAEGHDDRTANGIAYTTARRVTGIGLTAAEQGATFDEAYARAKGVNVQWYVLGSNGMGTAEKDAHGNLTGGKDFRGLSPLHGPMREADAKAIQAGSPGMYFAASSVALLNVFPAYELPQYAKARVA